MEYSQQCPWWVFLLAIQQLFMVFLKNIYKNNWKLHYNITKLFLKKVIIRFFVKNYFFLLEEKIWFSPFHVIYKY